MLIEKIEAQGAGKLVTRDMESVISSIIHAHDSSFIAVKIIVYV